MKHYYIVLLLALFSCQLFEKESKPTEVYGCMDSTAVNYNPEATIDDGSCQYTPADVYGCTDSLASNYDPEANIDDGSCDYCREGASFILMSKDGGENWSLMCLSDSIGQVSDIALIDTNNIWLCTYANNNIPNAQLLYTNDSGKTWEEQISYDNSILGQISFEYLEMFDMNNGITLANDWTNFIPIFLMTIDGGENWIQTTTNPFGISGDIWRRVDFVDINTGFLFESFVNPQKLLKTEDSGVSWHDTNFDDYAYVLKFYDDEIGITNIGDGIRRTLDGGITWENIEGINTTWSADIEFNPNDPSRVWVLSDSLYFSSDTGSTWTGCFECDDIGFDAIGYSNSSLWVFNGKRYLIKVDANDCDSYIEYQLPEYPYGHLNLGSNFEVIGDVIVIPGQF